MSNIEDKISDVEKFLVKGYRHSFTEEPDESWYSSVMEEIREEHLRKVRLKYYSSDYRFIWRFAAVACTVAAVLTIYVAGTGIMTDQIAINLFMKDPVADQVFNFITLFSDMVL